MEKVFLPPQQKMLNRNRILLVGLLLLALALIVLANLKIFIDFASVFVTVAFLLAVPFFYVLYRLNQANHISYAIGEDCLNVVWGVNRLQIPLREIDWAHHVDDFEQKLPLPRWHLPGAFLNHFEIRGLGKTRFIATDPKKMILIKFMDRYCVVSPDDPSSFLSLLQERQALAPLCEDGILEETFKTLTLKIRQDAWMKRWALFGGIALGLLWLCVLLMIGMFETVTWVTLEEVRSSQLLLLAIMGTFAWMVSIVIAFFAIIQSKAEKLLVYMLLASSMLTCLILAVATLMMSL